MTPARAVTHLPQQSHICHSIASMTRAAARVGGGLARDGDELPGVRPVRQAELEHAVYAADPSFAVRDDQRVGTVETAATGPHDDLPDAVRIRGASRVLGREPLVVLHVRVDDQLGPGGVEIVPERLHGPRWGEGRRGRRVEARVVEQRQLALLGARREVRLEPRLLRRADGRGHVGVVAVQYDDMPGAEVVAVVALAGRASRGAEVIEVARGRGARIVLMVAHRRVRAGLVTTPPAI